MRPEPEPEVAAVAEDRITLDVYVQLLCIQLLLCIAVAGRATRQVFTMRRCLKRDEFKFVRV